MSAEDGSVTLNFGGVEHRFRIAFGQWRELQESVNKPRLDMGMPIVGPRDLFLLLVDKNAWAHDVREIIRLGLIGGGMKPDRALVLVKRHLEGIEPWFLYNETARDILQVAMFGPPDDQVGKEPTPTGEPERTATTDASGSEISTASVLQ